MATSASQLTAEQFAALPDSFDHPVELITLKFVKQKLDYVHSNPVETGIVYSPYDYVYSSASAYAGRFAECPLPVELLEMPLWK